MTMTMKLFARVQRAMGLVCKGALFVQCSGSRHRVLPPLRTKW